MSLDVHPGACIHPRTKLLFDICPHTLLLYDNAYFLNSHLTTINFYKNHLKKSLKTLKLSHFQLFFKYLLVFPGLSHKIKKTYLILCSNPI